MMLCSFSSMTRKRPSGRISSIRPSRVISSSLAIGSGRLEVHGGLLAAAIHFQLVGNALVLVEGAHARCFDGGDVDERVARTVFVGNEAVALVDVEEFDAADWHG